RRRLQTQHRPRPPPPRPPRIAGGPPRLPRPPRPRRKRPHRRSPGTPAADRRAAGHSGDAAPSGLIGDPHHAFAISSFTQTWRPMALAALDTAWPAGADAARGLLDGLVDGLTHSSPCADAARTLQKV